MFPTLVRCETRLADLLLDHLQADLASWPGCDGMNVPDILLGYRKAAAAGRAPGLQELLTWHPDLADELMAFFGG
jgi:hypothetical protein